MVESTLKVKQMHGYMEKLHLSLAVLTSWIKRSLSESLLYLRHLKFGGAVKAIFRQRIAHIGYHEGLKMGAERRAKGDNDPSKGQIVILENYNDGNISG